MPKKFLSPIKLAQGASNPATGSAGEIFFNTTDTKMYIHNGTSWVISGGGVTVSDTKPSSPSNGDLWYYSAEGIAFMYYNDGNTGQWVQATSIVANADPNPMPAGSIMAWGGSTAPTNWMICDGSAISRSTYASLFAAIGTTYGSGDGSTTFNIPDIKGRVVVGFDSLQSEFNFLGETGGAKTHTLTIAEMPSHTHIQNAHNHTQDPHTHSLSGTLVSSFVGYGQNSPINGNATNPSSGGVNSTTATNQATTATNQNTGGGGAHNNLQPYITLNYIIKLSAGVTPGDSQLATRVGTLETKNNQIPLSQNYIINGAFDIWQRGTSFSSAGYTADRWAIVAASGQTVSVSQQTFTPGSAPVAGYEGTYFSRLLWSGTPSGTFWFTQRVEDVRTFAGQTATLSFWAKATSNTSVFTPMIEQNFGSGGSAGVSVTSSAINITTSWQRFTATFSVPSIAGKTIGANSYLDVRPLNGGSSVAGNSIDIWGVQLEAGSNATPFRRNSPSIQAELAACHRYYKRWTSYASGYVITQGWTASTTIAQFDLQNQMRVAPTSFEAVNVQIYRLAGIAVTATPSIYAPTETNTVVRFTGSAGSFTSTPEGVIIYSTSAGGYIALSAEL